MKRLFKTLTALTLAAIMCLGTLTAFASSDTVTRDYAGSCSFLMAIKNPEAVSSTTSTKTFVLSAVAVPGAIITLYKLNPETNLYDKIYVDYGPLETAVGASGLYAQQITLAEGMNNYMVYATNGFDDQAIHLEIKLLSEGIIDKIKSLTIDFANSFNK